jgi:hypothetical protein
MSARTLRPCSSTTSSAPTREAAETFVAEVEGDEPDLAALRVETIELG